MMQQHEVMTLVMRFGEILNYFGKIKIFPKRSAKLLAIFRLLSKQFSCPPKELVEKLHIYYAIQYFHFCQHFEITHFAEILKIVAVLKRFNL